MQFWIILSLITFVICGIAFYPLLQKQHKISVKKRDQLNKAFYFDRLQEVKREEYEGLIDDHEQTKIELQQSLLEDIPESTTQAEIAHRSLGKIGFVLLILFVGGISSAIYWNVGSWFTSTMLDKSHQKLDYFYERIKNETTDPLSDEEMHQFAMALRVELQRKPTDDTAWFLLGQIGMATDNPQMALESYAKASVLKPDNLFYKQKYAEILLFSADPRDKQKGEELVREIIRLDHANTGALRLLAFHLFEQEDYKMAARTWTMLLKLLPADDPSRAVIERSIRSALSQLSLEEKAAFDNNK